MDSDRWAMALSSKHARSSSKKRNNSDRSMDGKNRYKHDMEQANAMRGRSRKDGGDAAATKVELGLQGLEEADALQQRGELERALKLYSQSIELLLKCIKQPSAGFDQDVVSARVTVAMSDAERVKARLQQNKRSPPQQPSSQPTQESPKSAFESLSSSLAAALGGSPEWLSSSLATALGGSPSSDKQAPVPRRSPSDTGGHSTSMTSNRQSPPSASHTAVRPVSHSAARRPSPPSQQQRRRPKLDYNNDPYVQTVKADLYVDPSELQSTTWDDIAGLEKAKRSLQESAILPLLRPDLYTGLRKPQNILLYGPPGTGKTMLVRAVAYESQCLLFACTASALTSKWHGEGEKLVRTLFRVARDAAPSIIFVDEMDALLSSRNADEQEASRRFKTEFMVQIEGIRSDEGQHVLVVGCTNCPWDVDDAVMRRFPRRIYIPLPDSAARKGLLTSLLKKAGKHNLTSRHVSIIAQKTEGFSCSDIASIASEASFGPLRSLGGMDAIRDVRSQDVRPISVSDFDAAIQNSTKSVTPALLQKYKQWEQQQSSSP